MHYKPNIQCRRVWMPIMLHCLDVLRVNAYIVCLNGAPDTNHKKFLVEWIEALLNRAKFQSTRVTARRNSHDPATPREGRRRRVSSKNPTLPENRLVGSRSVHVEVLAPGSQKSCAYCSYQRAIDKANRKEEPHTVSRVTRKCAACDTYLCKPHFAVYHGWQHQ